MSGTTQYREIWTWRCRRTRTLSKEMTAFSDTPRRAPLQTRARLVFWVLAAIGATIGLGLFTAAVAFAMLTIAVLTGVDVLESSFRRLRSGAYAEDDGSQSER